MVENSHNVIACVYDGDELTKEMFLEGIDKKNLFYPFIKKLVYYLVAELEPINYFPLGKECKNSYMKKYPKAQFYSGIIDLGCSHGKLSEIFCNTMFNVKNTKIWIGF